MSTDVSNNRICNDDIATVTDFIGALKSENHQINELFGRLEQLGDLILIGGAIRDLVLLKRTPRDLDIIVDCFNMIDDALFTGFDFKRNRFGGYKLTIGGTIIDIWEIGNSWAFKQNFKEPCVENLKFSAFYNIDSLYINLHEQKLEAEFFNEALRSREIDIIIPRELVHSNPTPPVNITRLLTFCKQWGVGISKNVQEYVLSWLERVDNPIEEIMMAQAAHYGYEKMSVEEVGRSLEHFVQHPYEVAC